MKLLAIETSTMFGGLAVLDSGNLIAESRLNVRTTHSERLLPEIRYIMSQSGLSITDIDVFAISIGPGSFTGLRVGLSAVKGLVYPTDAKLVSVPTLEAFAWNIPFSAYPVCPLLDARKKEVYAGLFRWSDNGFIRVINEQAVSIDNLISKIKEKTIFIGEGAMIYRENIQKGLGEMAIFAPPQAMSPSPSNVAFLGMIKALRGDFDDPVTLAPYYIRKSEAEVKFKG
ncbi:MAG: tRNA (adenosine(37)-N6)-threonylcarbamoyltransferase complex dimerization subunit type 1 TsaB [Nitrospirae bacterium]|nr:tRNA (adenosine(37)-N6)-threonylcarbamoyltransferase complex dimerization subunit type 1 TsaB [Nitrospirota bacterium]